ncbi:MAG: undecaprenyl-diphosphate phosphatase [Candidatus Sericytochromatia bacterium]|nr:undecaprenyl-diphosphate phosphatase [Candidatus Sericytochromatia bacterium]
MERGIRRVEILQAIILGVVQGLTEFLPVSSTAHLVLFPIFLGWKANGLAFDVALHIGTLVAVFGYFRNDLLAILKGGLRSLRKPDLAGDPDQRMAWFLVVSCLPAVIAGLFFEDKVATVLRHPLVIGVAMLAFSIVLLVAERVGVRTKDLRSMGWREALMVGFAQALAIIPGASRSGVTMTAGLFGGLRREAAARFSFLLGSPIILGAAILESRHLLEDPNLSWSVVGAGILASGVSGYMCIRFLLRYLRENSTMVFIVYRLVVGAILVALALTGRLPEGVA